MLLATLVCLILSRILFRTKSDIPMAHGGIPFLGHALAYKQDPASFLCSQHYPIFQINLVGRRMIVVSSDERAMKQVATLPERILSARQAVADVGFEYTLGLFNVYKGTDWHKRILKDYVYNQTTTRTNVMPAVFENLVTAFDKETSTQNDNNMDLFVLMRRCMLRAMLTYMIAPSILDGQYEKFLTDFMEFQDMVEDATAKAAVLPRFLSVPLVLQPVQRKRLELTMNLTEMIQTTWRNNGTAMGPWLQAFRKEDIAAEEAAELTLGLMFAAHKNPAIGVSQCFCNLQTEATSNQQEIAMREAKSLYDAYSNGKLPVNPTESLRCCVLETLRLTAHSIGGIRTAQKAFILESSTGQTYSIEQGDVIAISHIATHRDVSVWGADACDYRQDRWETLQDTTKAVSGVPVDDYKYTTFSHGVHKCPGEVFALSMMEMMLAVLLVRNVELVDKKQLPKVSFERATLAQRDGSVFVTVGTGAENKR